LITNQENKQHGSKSAPSCFCLLHKTVAIQILPIFYQKFNFMKIFILFLILISSSAFAQLSRSDTAEINKVLNSQLEAWNNADLEGFMQGYWKSDSLVFIGSKGATYGWQKTLDNYKKTYSNTELIGKLSFNILEKRKLADGTAMVIGQWIIDRKQEQLKGHFLIIIKRIAGQWLIVADHSS